MFRSQDTLKAAAREGVEGAFEFFNKYAGQLRPETATDAAVDDKAARAADRV